MQDLFSPKEGYINYKTAISKVAPPCLPNFTLTLGEITLIEQMMHEKRIIDGKEYLNIDKLIKISEIIQQVDLYRTPFNLKKVDAIFDFFSKGLIFLGDDILFQKSREIEANTESGGKKSALNRVGKTDKGRKSILMKEKEKEKDKKKKKN
jgi:hypothetical protein